MQDYISNKNNTILIDLSACTNINITTEGGADKLSKIIGFGYDGGYPTIVIGNSSGVVFGGYTLISVDTAGYPRWVAQYVSSNEIIEYQATVTSKYDSQVEIELSDDIELTEEQYNIFNHFFVQ